MEVAMEVTWPPLWEPDTQSILKVLLYLMEFSPFLVISGLVIFLNGALLRPWAKPKYMD